MQTAGTNVDPAVRDAAGHVPLPVFALRKMVAGRPPSRVRPEPRVALCGVRLHGVGVGDAFTKRSANVRHRRQEYLDHLFGCGNHGYLITVKSTLVKDPRSGPGAA